MPFILEQPNESEMDFMAESMPENTSSSMKRHLARGAARTGETILGLPGDIRDTALFLSGGAAKFLGAPEEKVEEAKELVRKAFPGFKSSTELKEEITEPLTGEYLKPRSKTEELGDEIIQDATALLLPVKGVKGFKLGSRLLKSFGIAGGANLLSSFMGSLGIGEKGKAATKVGSMLLMGSLGKGSPKQYVSNLYKQAEEAVGAKASVNALPLKYKLRGLKKEMKMGLGAPSEKSVSNAVDKILKKINKGDGKLRVKELMASKRSLNEILTKEIYENPSKGAKARAKHLLKGVNKDLDSAIAKYGNKNPKFMKAYKSAQEGFGALAQSQIVGNFIKNNAKYSPMSLLLYPLIHAAPAGSLGGAAAAAGTYKIGQLGYRISKSPTLRKYYMDVLKEAARENSAGMNRALKKLDEELVKTAPEEKGRFIME